jgi:hypothetical protein
MYYHMYSGHPIFMFPLVPHVQCIHSISEGLTPKYFLVIPSSSWFKVFRSYGILYIVSRCHSVYYGDNIMTTKATIQHRARMRIQKLLCSLTDTVKGRAFSWIRH